MYLNIPFSINSKKQFIDKFYKLHRPTFKMKQKFQVGNLNIVDVNALSRKYLLFLEPSTT